LKLSIAILQKNLSWNELVKQIGISFVEADSLESFPLNDFACFVIPSSATNYDNEKIKSWIETGGTAIIEANAAEKIFKKKLKKIRVNYLIGDENIFEAPFYCEIFDKLIVSHGSNMLPNQKKQNVLEELIYGKGKIFIIPSNFADLIFNNQVKRKNFPSKWSNNYTTERAAKINKGKITELIRKLFQNLFHFKKLPFVSLWNFSNGENNLFCFRIDTDFGSEEDITNLYSLLKKNNIPGTWFVETQSGEKNINIFKEMENQEIGFHCFRHRIFRSYKKNYDDIKIGLKILKNHNIFPKGYAAPYGEWTANLAAAVENHQFSYSSEFCYGYDSLPFRPMINEKISSVLQMPIHPVSVGRLHWGGHSEETMVKYFTDIIHQKIFMDEPILIYTHPAEKKLKVFDNIFNIIRENNINALSMSGYANWWKKRLSAKWDAEFMDGEIKITSQNLGDTIYFKAVYPNKTIKRLSPQGEIKIINKSNYLLKYFPEIIPDEQSKTTIKMLKHDLLSKFRKYKQ
jgi:hypothetical protein